jgi:hypothetical protein
MHAQFPDLRVQLLSFPIPALLSLDLFPASKHPAGSPLHYFASR